ncbi:pyridoxal-dependent decarboxylase [Streptomyces sp. NPDC005953]|uniref:pyridoxal phosphate-dependent decarboxylase family protein n=1 Tax=Streptomyces sp. NPDC005953 TaxID=3156719 RepID=UPI00340A95EB
MDPLYENGLGRSALEFVLASTFERQAKLPDLHAYSERELPDLIEEFPLPQYGIGSLGSVRTLWDLCNRYAANTIGPRYFDFVIGGVLPAALAADWVTATFDQNAAGRVTGDLATEVEILVMRWLKELLGLTADWHGVMVPSATYGNVAGLACARQWCGQQIAIDVVMDGARGLPPIKVVGSSFVHPSVEKALQMLGMGRKCLTRFDLTDPDTGLARMREALADSGPAIVIASAGEVNGGEFDPITRLAQVARETGAWLHVDAAFGMIAAFDPNLAENLDGIHLADSIAADGHKWLNVPYDSGFALIREKEIANRTFGMPSAPYLEDLTGASPGFASLGPDASRRARAFPVFVALLAYGTAGIRNMIKRQMKAISRLVALIDDSTDYRILIRPTLPIVTFRAEPPGILEDELDELNQAIASKVNATGHFAVGVTMVSGRKALRVALLNWGITDVIAHELFAELSATLADMDV